jgi:hypothetical protein
VPDAIYELFGIQSIITEMRPVGLGVERPAGCRSSCGNNAASAWEDAELVREEALS